MGNVSILNLDFRASGFFRDSKFLDSKFISYLAVSFELKSKCYGYSESI